MTADVVAARVGVLVTARIEEVERAVVAGEDVRVKKVVSVLEQGPPLQRVLVHLHGRGLDQNHHTVHAAGASRLTAPLAIAHAIGHAVVVFLRIEWQRD